MTIFTICIFYAPTVPLVPLAAWSFVTVRHWVDGFNLLTYYRKEIDSSGTLIDHVTKTALMVVVFYQICMIAYFMIHSRRDESIACALLFVGSLFYAASTFEEVKDMSFEENNINEPNFS